MVELHGGRQYVVLRRPLTDGCAVHACVCTCLCVCVGPCVSLCVLCVSFCARTLAVAVVGGGSARVVCNAAQSVTHLVCLPCCEATYVDKCMRACVERGSSRRWCNGIIFIFGCRVCFVGLARRALELGVGFVDICCGLRRYAPYHSLAAGADHSPLAVSCGCQTTTLVLTSGTRSVVRLYRRGRSFVRLQRPCRSTSACWLGRLPTLM